jgi:hypothetical protein
MVISLIAGISAIARSDCLEVAILTIGSNQN